MSYIDCFNHEVVGEVLTLPLYKANQDINGDEFHCKKGQLILGGGSGEHPAMVIEDINYGMLVYLWFHDDIDSDEFTQLKDFDFRKDIGLKFDDWAIPTTYHFYKLALDAGYDENESGFFDMWLISLIVETVLEKQPELIDIDLRKLIS